MQKYDRERVKVLLVEHARGVLDEAGERELEGWRRECPGHEAMFQRLMSAREMERATRRFVRSREEEERAWRRLVDRTIGRREGRRIGRWARYAAAMVVAVGAGLAAWRLAGPAAEEPGGVPVAVIEPGKARAELILPRGERVLLGDTRRDTLAGGVNLRGDTLSYQQAAEETREEPVETHTLRIPRGGEYTLELTDGTTVCLNAETELRYPSRFTGGERRVWLKGEAYFDVARDEASPFVVETEGMDVRVLGTEFGVRAYGGESETLTTLVEGRVRVDAGGEEAELAPGQQAVFERKEGKVNVREVDVEEFVGWKDGRLVFDNKPLWYILDELGRWYSFEVFYSNEESKHIPFSLNVRKHEDIAPVLKLVERTGKVWFEINGNAVIVK